MESRCCLLGSWALATCERSRKFKPSSRKYPGTVTFGPPVHTAFPWWLRYQQYFNLVFMLFIIQSGLQIQADHPRLTLDARCLPETAWLRLRGAVPEDRLWKAKDDSVGLPPWLGLPGIRHSIGLARMVALQPGPSLGSDRSRSERQIRILAFMEVTAWKV